MNDGLNRRVSVVLVFIWMLVSTLKLIFFKMGSSDLITANFVVDSFFWGTSFLIILNYIIVAKANIPLISFVTAIFLFCSLIIFNYKIATVIYLFFLWFAIAKTISRKDFEYLYAFCYLFCFIYIGFFVALNGQSFYYDSRYGYIPSFGFINPNSFAQFVTVIYIFSARGFLLSIFLSFFLYLVFNDIIYARSFYFILILQPILFLIIGLFSKRIISLFPIFIFIISLSSAMLVGTEYGLFLDTMFSGRGYYSSLLLSELNSIPTIFFGSTEKFDDLPVDVSFISALYDYGLFVVLIIVYLYVKVLNLIHETKDNTLNVVIISFLSYCLVENVIVSYFLNFTLYYIISAVFFSSSKKYI